jgi:hypothetical protein
LKVEIMKLAITIFVAFATTASAGTVRDNHVIACPSIQLWADIFAESKLQDAANLANEGGCVRVPAGTSVKIVDEAGPFARVIAPDGRRFFFRTQDIRK